MDSNQDIATFTGWELNQLANILKRRDSRVRPLAVPKPPVTWPEAPSLGFEPRTHRLTADCSTTELTWNGARCTLSRTPCLFGANVRRYVQNVGQRHDPYTLSRFIHLALAPPVSGSGCCSPTYIPYRIRTDDLPRERRLS